MFLQAQGVNKSEGIFRAEPASSTLCPDHEAERGNDEDDKKLMEKKRHLQVRMQKEMFVQEQKKRDQEKLRRQEEWQSLQEERRQEWNKQKLLRHQEEMSKLEQQRKYQEELQRQELKRQEELRIREERRQEELRQQEVRRFEEERLKQVESEERLRQEERQKRKQALREETRATEIRLQKQAKMYEEERRRYEELKRREDAARREQELLEQQMRLALEQQQLRQQQRPTPKLRKAQSFNNEHDLQDQIQRSDAFAKVRTGNVEEKRQLWQRSCSSERLSGSMSAMRGPRRKWLGEQDWIRQQHICQKIEDNQARPGSSLAKCSVRSTVAEWASLSKSQSSGAVMMEGSERHRPVSRSGSSLANKIETARSSQEKLYGSNKGLDMKEVKTNQVRDTVSRWGSSDDKEHEVQAKNTPSRNIGKTFAENRIARDVARMEAAQTRHDCSTNTPRKSPEPALRLVNVSVERSKLESNCSSIHISESANELMASVVQSKGKREPDAQETTTSESHGDQANASKSSTQDFVTSTQIARNEVGRDVNKELSVEASSAQRPFSYAHPSVQLKQIYPKDFDKNLPQSAKKTSSIEKPPRTFGLSKNKSGSLPRHDKEKMRVNGQSTPTNLVTPVQTGASPPGTQEHLPMPVEQSWFDKMRSDASNSTTTPATAAAAGAVVTEGNKQTPIPVLAGWFEEEQRKKVHHEEEAIQTASSVQPTLPAPPPPPSTTTTTEEHSRTIGDVDKTSFSSIGTTDEKLAKESIAALPQTTQLKEELNVPKSPFVQSRQIYLQKGSSSEKEEAERSQRRRELEEIALVRSQTNWDECSASEKHHDSVREARTRELQEIAASRSQSAGKNAPEDPAQNEIQSGIREARERELQEVASVRAKAGNLSVGGEVGKAHEFMKEERGKELQEIAASRSKASWNSSRDNTARLQDALKEARAQELREVASARAGTNWDVSVEKLHESVREARITELQEVKAMRSTCTGWEDDVGKEKLEQARGERQQELKEIAHIRAQTNWEEDDTTKKEKVAKSQRDRELQEIAAMRSQTNWDEEMAVAIAAEETEAEEEKRTRGAGGSRYKQAVSAWKQRELGEKQPAEPNKGPPPSRSIGDLLNKSADQWHEIDHMLQVQESMLSSSCPSPPPPLPPRESSKTFMRTTKDRHSPTWRP